MNIGIPPTLSRYLARNYFVNMVLLLLALLAVIYLFDTVELIRRASKRSDIPLSLVLQMGLLKLPEVGQVLLPFAILFSAMYTFWQLTRRHELVVVRAAGFSVWQFLAPVIGVAMVTGLFLMTVINPIGALLVGKYEQLEALHLEREQNQIALFKEGLWLRQGAGSEDGYVILHAGNISQKDWVLRRVNVLYFDAQDQFYRRVDAKAARLEPGQWIFENASLYEPPSQTLELDRFGLETNLTKTDIEESFSSPETMSFWQLPGHIQTLEETGFDAARLRVHYHKLLAQPLMFAAMVLIAAAVSMRPPRFTGAFVILAAGVLIGFVVFFLSSFLQALGVSQQIPPVLAAWSPALICVLLGLSVLMSLEDG